MRDEISCEDKAMRSFIFLVLCSKVLIEVKILSDVEVQLIEIQLNVTNTSSHDIQSLFLSANPLFVTFNHYKHLGK